jgi:hypothetical protein
MSVKIGLLVRGGAAVVLAAGAAVAVAGPAQAHPEIRVTCDPVPNCDTVICGGVTP